MDDEYASRGTLPQFSHCSGARTVQNKRFPLGRREAERCAGEDRDRPGSVGGPWLIDN